MKRTSETDSLGTVEAALLPVVRAFVGHHRPTCPRALLMVRRRGEQGWIRKFGYTYIKKTKGKKMVLILGAVQSGANHMHRRAMRILAEPRNRRSLAVDNLFWYGARIRTGRLF